MFEGRWMRDLVNFTVGARIEFLDVPKVRIIATCPGEFGRSWERGCALPGHRCAGFGLQGKSVHRRWSSGR